MDCRVKFHVILAIIFLLDLHRYVNSTEASWNSWSTWSDCNKRCDGGVMSRNRACSSPSACAGDNSQTKRCNIHRCEDTCQRAFDSNNKRRCCYFPSIIDVSSQLTHYNACFPSNQTVNATDESRKNSNIPDCYYVCPLDKNGTEYGACAGNRVWNEWSNWSACSHSCFTGIKTRYRTENITRFLNGRTVYRNESEQALCNQQPCANATTLARRSNGSLTYCFFNDTEAGSPFGECWLTAGKTYECFLDRFGNETGTCEPINGNYTNWSTWSSCSHDCFSGIQTRNRTCVNAKYYGICLDPKTTDLQYCNRKPCYDLSNCTKAIFDGNTTCCMLGMELNDSRTHYKCEQNINVLSDGKYRCPIDRYGMNYGICEPIHGKWSPWSNWTECKKVHTCKDTIKEQYRNCSQPEYGGDPCQGPAVNTTACVMENCPPDTFWSDWKLDKPCSVTCGEGKEVWKRDCMHIDGNMVLESECQGIARSTNSCRQMDCPGFFLGDLGENCSSSCSRRNLTCRWLEKPFPNDYTEELSKLNVRCLSESNGIEIWTQDWQPAYNQSQLQCVGFKNVKYSRCSQSQRISESKVQRLCRCIYQGDLKYSEWSAWSGCSAYCGSAYKTRKRICLSNNPADCLETLSQNATCDLETCPDDEGFSSWSSWSKCSAHCNAGLAHRYRICNNKIYCFGHVNESKLCNTQPCQVHGNWTEWSELSVCSKSCGHGNKERIRSCTNPAPLYGGNNCTGDAIEIFPCNTFNCTVDIGYTSWSIWGECSTSCGMGVKKRYRSCKGISCNGTLEDTGPCDNQLCPVDGGWTDYTVWSPCSKTCGGGKRTRYRYCTNPKPRNGGLHCDGDSSQEEECNFHICPVHGMWGAWGNWSLCDKPCNNGTKRRVRFCDNPKPQYNGRYCIGQGEMKQICNSHPCKAVSIGIHARFWNETYTDELANLSSIEFKNLESKIGRNVMDLYISSDGNIESHVESVSVQFFSNGSVYSNFTVIFTEVSSYELIILVTSIQERDLLNSMPVNFFQINADDIPSSPKSIAASAVNETCIRVKWSNFTSSITSFNLTAFTVIYRDTSTTKWKSVLVNPTVVEAYLTRLQPYTLYTLRVTALTYDALGIPSDLQDVQTLEGVPTEPPGNTSCRATSSSVIFCSWSDVPYQSQNGFITKFLIKYRKYSDPGSLIISSNNPWSNVSFPATANSGTVSGLEFFTRYELQIHGVTSAGVGTGQWLTVKTEEDVPSSDPLNIKAKSYFSNKYLDISWDSIPSDKWNGRPLGIVLKYSITRKASTSIVGGPTVVIDKKYDERFHRITGLEANWEVTITLQGKTAAGDGVKSAPVVGETCRCDQKLYTAWYEKNPYIFKQGNAVKGIYPDLLSSMVPQICGKCDAYGSTLVYFDRTKRGQNSVRTSESDMTAKLSDDVHFNVPAGGNKEQTLYQGQYQYINVIDSTGSVFVVVDQSKASKTSAMVQSLGRVWPLLVVSILMMILAGILLWMVDQFENPEELEKGRFFAGSFRGFWWAFVSMTTLGYGDIAPRGTLGRMIGVIWTSIGLIINGILISTISTALTVISVKQQTMLYGANVSAVSNSSQYILGIRRNANMNSTGQHYLTSKAAIDALIQRKVQGTLLDLNEAANMQTVISKNGLKIVKVIESTSGMGMILSGEMISFHSKIRSYVSDNSAYITGLTKNYTKTVEIPVVKARDKSVTGMFSSSSDTFKSLLKGSLFILAGAVVLGLLWSFVIRIYLKRRARVHPQRSPEQALQAYYNKWTDEIIAHGEDFVRDLKENWQEMEVRHGRERFRLLSKHFKKKSFGATAWMKYKSFDQQYIIKKMRIEEAFLENLHRKRHRKMIKKIKLMDITEDDLRVDHHEYKM